MKKLFTDKELTAISFLVVMFFVGVAADQYKDYAAENRLEKSIPRLLAENEKFKIAAAMLQSEYDSASIITKLNDDGTLHSIEINMASISGLTLLPGIGPIIAERIVHMRDSVGSFESVDELLAIKGIGTKKLNKIKPFVIIRDKNGNAKNQ